MTKHVECPHALEAGVPISKLAEIFLLLGQQNMPKRKTELQRSAGKLISAIQKEWGNDLGESNAEFSEDVMNAAHDLLQAETAEEARKVLGQMTVRQYLGDVWVQRHPNVKPAIAAVEAALQKAP